jgi:hypothetical protein
MSIPRDKLLHIAAGAVAGLAFIALVLVTTHAGLAWAVLAAGALTGFGYEGLQRYRGEGRVELADALATTAGGALVALAVAWMQ